MRTLNFPAGPKPAKTSPNLKFCLIKIAYIDLYTTTLASTLNESSTCCSQNTLVHSPIQSRYLSVSATEARGLDGILCYDLYTMTFRTKRKFHLLLTKYFGSQPDTVAVFVCIRYGSTRYRRYSNTMTLASVLNESSTCCSQNTLARYSRGIRLYPLRKHEVSTVFYARTAEHLQSPTQAYPGTLNKEHLRAIKKI